MKKLLSILLTTTLLFIASCDSNDEAQSINDPLVGTWAFHETINIGSNTDIPQEQLDCERKGRVTVNDNLNLNVVTYAFDQQQGCQEYARLNDQVTKKDDGTYSISSNSSIFTLMDASTLKIQESDNWYDVYKKIN